MGKSKSKSKSAVSAKSKSTVTPATLKKQYEALKAHELQADKEFTEFFGAMRNALHARWYSFGKSLIEAKEKYCKHGKWIEFIKRTLDIEARQVQKYMKCAKDIDQLMAEAPANTPSGDVFGSMPASLNRLLELSAKPREPKLQSEPKADDDADADVERSPLSDAEAMAVDHVRGVNMYTLIARVNQAICGLDWFVAHLQRQNDCDDQVAAIRYVHGFLGDVIKGVEDGKAPEGTEAIEDASNVTPLHTVTAEAHEPQPAA